MMTYAALTHHKKNRQKKTKNMQMGGRIATGSERAPSRGNDGRNNGTWGREEKNGRKKSWPSGRERPKGSRVDGDPQRIRMSESSQDKGPLPRGGGQVQGGATVWETKVMSNPRRAEGVSVVFNR